MPDVPLIFPAIVSRVSPDLTSTSIAAPAPTLMWSVSSAAALASAVDCVT
jgi:hypothetical protein